jgi:hypothetical protein
MEAAAPTVSMSSLVHARQGSRGLCARQISMSVHHLHVRTEEHVLMVWRRSPVLVSLAMLGVNVRTIGMNVQVARAATREPALTSLMDTGALAVRDLLARCVKLPSMNVHPILASTVEPVVMAWARFCAPVRLALQESPATAKLTHAK